MDSRSAVGVRRSSGERDAGVREEFHALDPGEASSFTAWHLSGDFCCLIAGQMNMFEHPVSPVHFGIDICPKA